MLIKMGEKFLFSNPRVLTIHILKHRTLVTSVNIHQAIAPKYTLMMFMLAPFIIDNDPPVLLSIATDTDSTALLKFNEAIERREHCNFK